MVKNIAFFAFFIIATHIICDAWATARPSDYVSANTYNNLYPYMNNTMRTNLNPGTNPSQSNAHINVLTRTSGPVNTTKRGVVPRRASTTTATARSATSASPTATAVASRGVSQRRTSGTSTNARAAATYPQNARVSVYTTNQNSNSQRRVVARSGTGGGVTMHTAARASRDDGNVSTARQSTSAVYTTEVEPISSARCMADYASCMDGYCKRANTEYNRCYCSAKLAQIDSKYQPEIDSLIKEILSLKTEKHWTDEEMNEYWMETVGKYTGDNSWENLDQALDIDWASMASSVRGQQAFATGHQYCVQHLRGCAYMQTNMRDAYRSEIARDCTAYESSLQKLKNAAESIVESYQK